MRLAELGERLAGGALPIIHRNREVFPVDGTAYTVELTVFRRQFTIRYHTPRHPRDARRIRAAERVHLGETVRRHSVGEDHVQVGDIIPGHRWIPGDVDEFRNDEFDVWRRAVGEERFNPDDLAELGHHSQEYDWVTVSRDGTDICGWSTDEGALDYAPLTVTKVRDRATKPA